VASLSGAIPLVEKAEELGKKHSFSEIKRKSSGKRTETVSEESKKEDEEDSIHPNVVAEEPEDEEEASPNLNVEDILDEKDDSDEDNGGYRELEYGELSNVDETMSHYDIFNTS